MIELPNPCMPKNKSKTQKFKKTKEKSRMITLVEHQTLVILKTYIKHKFHIECIMFEIGCFERICLCSYVAPNHCLTICETGWLHQKSSGFSLKCNFPSSQYSNHEIAWNSTNNMMFQWHFFFTFQMLCEWWCSWMNKSSCGFLAQHNSRNFKHCASSNACGWIRTHVASLRK